MKSNNIWFIFIETDLTNDNQDVTSAIPYDFTLFSTKPKWMLILVLDIESSFVAICRHLLPLCFSWFSLITTLLILHFVIDIVNCHIFFLMQFFVFKSVLISCFSEKPQLFNFLQAKRKKKQRKEKCTWLVPYLSHVN